MGDVERQYRDILKKSCEKVVLEYFPQIEAGDLICREITLEDIYVPLPLWGVDFTEINVRNGNIVEEEISGGDLRKSWSEMFSDDEYDQCNEYDRHDDYDRRDKCDQRDEYDIHSKSEWTALKELLNGEDFQEDAGDGRAVSCENAGSNSIGMRALLQGHAGGGKTFFCKRLVLAYLKNEVPFFEQYLEESLQIMYKPEKRKLQWEQNTFPLLLNCKYLKEMPQENLENILFPELAYRLCCMEFGEEFRRIGYESFCTLLETKAGGKCCFILDGWNEILDTRKEDTVWQAVKKYLQSYPMIDLIIAVRTEYESPVEWLDFSHFFEMKELTGEEIAAFCEKWYQVVFHDNQVNQKKYAGLTEQILQSPLEQVKAMAKIPLTLSLILAISRYDEKLPENRAVLLRELFDIYIFWNTKKGGRSISREAMTLYLAYIAVCFTKREIALCSYAELVEMIRQCNIDLRNSLPAEMDDYEIPEVIDQLTDTKIFGIKKEFMGNGYGFSMFSHIQEYLTAYAVLTQSADREYNSMEPEEILKDKYAVVAKKEGVEEPVLMPEDKYTVSRWKDVIVFAALMDTGKLRYTIIKKLLKKAKKTKAAYMSFYTHTDVSEEILIEELSFCIYRDMLKEIVMNVAEISPDYRQKMDEILNI